jgi:protein-S-isoprenylcysteine O-methyltransferase Ste14
MAVWLQSNLLELRTSIQEDWTTLPILVTVSMGFVVAVLDFIFLQRLQFQIFVILGVAMVLVGGYLRLRIRLELQKKAGFRSIGATARLQIVEGHQLITDGYYKLVRHPLYLGEKMRNLGLVIVFSSLFGACFIVVSTIILLYRMRIEEDMLVMEFGEEYRAYQRKTKRMIPYIY